MESQTCIFLGIKVKPGPIIRHKVENFPLENTVDSLKSEAEKETSVPSASLELIHHGKILKGNATLQDSGVKNGETVHVVKKKEPTTQPPAPTYSDAEIQQLNASLRMLGCTPNAPGWTRAMQLLNDESAMAEIVEQAPSLGEDCVMLSILHEVELLAALGANVTTMRRGASAHPELPRALRQLTRLVRARSTPTTNSDNALTSGFAYSLEALSEDEDADEEDNEEGERTPITHEQLTAALQAAEAASSSSRSGAQDSLLRLLQAADHAPDAAATTAAGARPVITPEMFREAITEAIASNRPRPAATPMEQNTAAASSSASPLSLQTDYTVSLQRMHEMGLRDDALNVRALIICEGDVNAAINLVFSGAIGDD
ncbi:ubiquitin-like protein 7 [Plodia interpunctella]|uniref:ubiquitin-like protein 7 n=1 Tax=Plodia interpunctella TaxID=58824 RepID=UPI0023675618|nr:ubiquitin-like protein 7 [Plodia interpunctella]